MTRKERRVTKTEIQALKSDEDLLKGLVQMAVQEFLEAEMNETVGAAKSERGCVPSPP